VGEDLGTMLEMSFADFDLVESKIMKENLGVQKTLE
jgi:hypothetical protein